LHVCEAGHLSDKKEPDMANRNPNDRSNQGGKSGMGNVQQHRQSGQTGQGRSSGGRQSDAGSDEIRQSDQGQEDTNRQSGMDDARDMGSGSGPGKSNSGRRSGESRTGGSAGNSGNRSGGSSRGGASGTESGV
jgi:hypothetical protein